MSAMRKYVIVGVQGSGKGTQAARLAGHFDLVHISVGDIFRWHVQHHTKIGAQVKRAVGEGHLASSSTGSPATSAKPSSSSRASTSTG
jgi:adenylate kinase